MPGEEPAFWKHGTSGNRGHTLGEADQRKPARQSGRSSRRGAQDSWKYLPPPLLPLQGSTGESSCESRDGVKASCYRYWQGA